MSKKTNNLLKQSISKIDVTQLALDFGLDDVKGYASAEVDGKKIFGKVTGDSTTLHERQKLYRGCVNGNIEYRHARSSTRALKSFRMAAFKKFGKFNITDLHVKTDTGWSRIAFTKEQALGQTK